MNERIRQLYIQAINDTKHDPADDINIQIAEKFAELIVRECALQCRHNDDMDRIEKHFGVEQDITTHEIKLTTDPERIRQANYLLNGGEKL